MREIDARDKAKFRLTRNYCFSRWMVSIAVAFLLVSPEAFAQNGLGGKTAPVLQNTPAKKLSPQEIQQLRQLLAKFGQKTTGQITLPITSRKQKYLGSLAALEKQKQAVAAHRTTIFAAAGKGRMPLGRVASPGNAQTNSTPLRTNLQTPPSGGAPPPQSTGGSKPLTVPASTAKAIQTSPQTAVGGQLPTLSGNGAKALQTSPGIILQNTVCKGPTIFSVNGPNNAPGASFSPDPQYNQFTIVGCGFGDQQGSAHLYGLFVSHQVNLNIEFWNDTAITGYTDPNVTGEPDQTGTVTLVVAPANGPQVQKMGLNFLAARARVQLQVIPQSQIKIYAAASGADIASGGDIAVAQGHTGSTGPTVDTSVLWPFQSSSWVEIIDFPGATLAVQRSSNQPFYGGLDTFLFNNLSPGFYADTAEFAHFDLRGAACNSNGNWKADWRSDEDGAEVWTQEQYCSPLVMGQSANALSLYAVWVWVVGPRGVNPWPSNLQ